LGEQCHKNYRRKLIISLRTKFEDLMGPKKSSLYPHI
jgi:hypothetical protein